jgi:hypothetical protein
LANSTCFGVKPTSTRPARIAACAPGSIAAKAASFLAMRFCGVEPQPASANTPATKTNEPKTRVFIDRA